MITSMDFDQFALASLFFLVAALYSSVGHAGASGRFERLKEVALAYAFALKIT